MADSTTAAPSPGSCLTHFKTEGNFYEFGFNVGSHFRERIQLFFRDSQDHQKIVLPLYDSQEGREFYEENLRVCQDCFPHYVRELRGLANGAGLPFEHVFMENVCESSVRFLLKQKAQRQVEQNVSGFGCSTIFISSRDTRVIVHNEDHHPLIKKYGYLVSADITEEGHTEKFTSFCYPGTLPGRAFSVNHRGLVFTSNVLGPAEMTRGAPSRIFHTRSLVTACDIEDAVRLARNEPYGTAYGFTANLSTKEGDMACLEIGPGKPQAAVHVQHVTRRPSGPDAESSASHYYHFNVYQHLKVPELKGTESSLHRAQRASQLPAPRGLRQVLDIMADTQDQAYPIFRTPSATDGGQTVCTAAFDVRANQLRLYEDREGLLADTPAVTLTMFE